MGRNELARTREVRGDNIPPDKKQEFELRLLRMQKNGTLQRIQNERERQVVQGRPRPVDANEFFKYINGKDVIFIGPAAYYEEPEELDYDVVARCNHGFESRPRTDVLYINNRFIKQEYALKTIEQAKNLGIRWVVTKHPAMRGRLRFHCGDVKLIGLREYFTRSISKEFNTINRGQTGINMGLFAIEHLRKTRLNSLTIRGIDFYESGYYDGYSPYHPVMDDEAMEKLQSKRTHDQDMHKNYFKKVILFDKRVDIDDTLRGVLGV